MPDTHTPQRGDIYKNCDPRGGPSIRITKYTPGTNRADVVDAATGKHPRTILVKHLHATDRTWQGARRRTGYALTDGAESHRDARTGPPATPEPHQPPRVAQRGSQ